MMLRKRRILSKTFHGKIKSGDYSFLLKLLQAAPTCKFFEKPTEYAAKYPYNTGYITAGGHTFEVDNTAGHERLHIQHKNGSSCELEPSGNMQMKIMKDMQAVVNGKMEYHSDSALILTNNNCELNCNTGSVTGRQSIRISSPDVSLNSTKSTSVITGGDMTISGVDTTISGSNGVEMTSGNTVFITSKQRIILDAPEIIIGTPANTNHVTLFGRAGVKGTTAGSSTFNFGPGNAYLTSNFININGKAKVLIN